METKRQDVVKGKRSKRMTSAVPKEFGRYLSPKDAEEYLGISAALIYKACADGVIPHAWIGKRIVIPRDLLDETILGQARETQKR